MLRFVAVLSLGLLCIVHLGCQNASDCDCSSRTSSDPGTPVTTASDQRIPFDEVASFAPGTRMRLLLNRQGTEVRSYEVTFEGALKDGTERLIIARTPPTLVVGAGDSGSPLLTEDGRVAGILCYGYFGANYQFLARAIDDVVAVGPAALPPALAKAQSAKAMQTLPLSYQASGIDQKMLLRLGVPEKYRARFNLVEGSGSSLRKSHQASSSTGLIPGMSIALHEVSGDVISFYAVGTISAVSDSLIHAFGHSYAALANRLVAKPITLASMQSMIESVFFAMKAAQSIDQPVGTLIRDDFNAVLIDRRKTAPTITSTVKIRGSEGGEQIFTHHVSHDVDRGWERILFELSTTSAIDRILENHKYRGWAKATVSIALEDSQRDSLLVVGDSTGVDTSSMENEYPDEPFGDNVSFDLAYRTAEAISSFVYDVARRPFTLKRIDATIELHPDTSAYYDSGSSWSLGR